MVDRVDQVDQDVAAGRDGYVCRRCGCACDAAGSRHRGGGPGMKACGKTPDPVLRSELASEAAAVVAAARARR